MSVFKDEDMLLKKLHDMPAQDLNRDSKNMIIKKIRSTGLEIEKRNTHERRNRWIAAAVSVCTLAVILSAGILTKPGRDYAARFAEGITSFYNKETGKQAQEPATGTGNKPVFDEKPGELNSAVQYISIADKLNGWAVTRYSVFHTSNGGNTWDDVTPKGQLKPFGGRFFLDKDHGWVASFDEGGSPGIIFNTADGGKTWSQVKCPVNGSPSNMYFIDNSHGWIMVHQGVAMHHEEVAIIKTDNGGASWSVISSVDPQNDKPDSLPFTGNKSGLGFINASTGWITGYIPALASPYIYKTTDGGRTWKQVNISIPEKYKGSELQTNPPIFFTDKDGLLPVTYYDEAQPFIFYVTHDGGATWKAGTPVNPVKGSLLSYDFVNMETGFASDGINIYKTKDGGNSWSRDALKTQLKDVSKLDFADEKTGWIISDSMLYKTEDGGVSWSKAEGSLPYLPSFTVGQATAIEDAAGKLFIVYLEHYKKSDIPEAERIKDYRIDDVKIINSSGTDYVICAKFSVQCTENSPMWTGDGSVKNNRWIEGKTLYITASMVGDSLSAKSIKNKYEPQ